MSRHHRAGIILGIIGVSIIGVMFLLYLVFVFEVDIAGRTLSRPIRLDGQVLVRRNQLPDHRQLTAEIDRILAPRLVTVRIDEAVFTTNTSDLALSASVDQILEAARIETDATGWREFINWLGSWWQWVRIRDHVSIDQDALAGMVDQWAEQLGLSEPYYGDIVIADDGVEVLSARPGAAIDQTDFYELILDELESVPVGEPLVITGSIEVVNIEEVQSSLEVIAGEFERLLDTTLVFTLPDDTTIPVTGAVVAGWFEVRWDDLRNEHELVIEPDTFYEALGLTEAVAQDASLGWDPETNEVSITPSRPGVQVDFAETVAVMRKALRRGDSLVSVAADLVAEPSVRTADLEELGIQHVIARFTTYHPCCQERVVNIHTMADRVDGVVLLPGETFSLNEYAGERTEAKGYLPAPSIEQRELVDAVGGGVSQFATTLYNAVFWGGLEDVTHAPHSRYFSRYPEGIEATVSWPVPNLVFRNDYDTPIMIKTAYTDTSITVAILGDNRGRSLVGEQSGGRTYTEISDDGESEARRVVAWTSDRYNYRDPGTDYIGDASLPRRRLVLEETGVAGWDVTVTRDIYEGDTLRAEDTWVVHYYPVPNLVRIHPCDIPEGEIAVDGDQMCRP